MIRLNLSVVLLAAAMAGACGGGGSMAPPPPCEGMERCDCYPNGTCNAGLDCLSNLCVGRGTGGAMGAAGATGTGGSTTGTAGTGPGTGGSSIGTAGTGGSSTGGTGGSTSGNLIKNGDFALGKTYWDLTYQAGEIAGSEYSNGEYCILNLSASLYLSFSLGYPPTPSDAFAIEPGATYTLTYRARFLAGISGALLPAVTVKIGHASPPYTMLVMFTGDTIRSANYATFTHIVSSATGDTGAGLVFNGTLDYVSEVCFDDVTLVKN